MDVIKEHDILPENIYNMDEKGIQLGIGAKITAMVDHSQKSVYSIEDGNRELVTIIECICADGSILHPSVIFQGLRRSSEWGRNNPCNARFVPMQFKRHWPHTFADSISVSPNGWTDQQLGIAWLQNDFDPATREKAAGQYRLLILDGHNSHCTFAFCKYANDNKIIIICLPSHTTHALQPCDVGAFGPLAQSWKWVVVIASQSLIAIRKDNLLMHYHTARIEALKPTTIQSAFRKTGHWIVMPYLFRHSSHQKILLYRLRSLFQHISHPSLSRHPFQHLSHHEFQHQLWSIVMHWHLPTSCQMRNQWSGITLTYLHQFQVLRLGKLSGPRIWCCGKSSSRLV